MGSSGKRKCSIYHDYERASNSNSAQTLENVTHPLPYAVVLLNFEEEGDDGQLGVVVVILFGTEAPRDTGGGGRGGNRRSVVQRYFGRIVYG